MATRNGSDGDDELIGTPQADSFRGFDGDDRLVGLAGNDLMRGGEGEDRLEGGAGTDTASYDYVPGDGGSVVDLDTGTASLRNGEDRDDLVGIENATGTRSLDFIDGDDGANVLRGLGTGDRLGGRGGDDLIDGGDGSDSLSGGAGDDRLVGASGQDTAFYFNSRNVSVDLAAGTATGSDGRDRLSSIEDVLGGNGNDVILGTSGANALFGRAGSDEIRGRGGDDTLESGFGSTSRLFGDAGNDEFGIGFGRDRIDGGSGTDTVRFAIEGNEPDTDGNGFPSGSDLVQQVGDISVFLDRGFATTEGGRAELTGIENVITGSEQGASNVIVGNGAANVLDSGDGADRLDGAGGADRLVSGLGADDLSGGGGADIFEVSEFGEPETVPGSRDRIRDLAEGDRVDLSNVDAVFSTLDRNEAFEFIGRTSFSEAGQLRYTTGNGGAVVQGSTDGDGAAELEIRLDGVSALQANDFVL